MSSPITGHCLCGNVTYSIDAPLQSPALCHCLDCRRSTGSAYSTVATVPLAAVTLNGGYKIFDIIGTSGKMAHRHFCPECGSPIMTSVDANPDIAFIKAGTLSDDIQLKFKPELELFTRSRLPYIENTHGLQIETQ